MLQYNTCMRHSLMIVGHGHVGTAISTAFKPDDVTIIDPKYNTHSISDYHGKKFDAIFVCVDTPAAENFKTLDGVLHELNAHCVAGTIVCCKSTATPAFYASAEQRYSNIHVLHSPEYLSHWDNINTFKNQTFIIIGGAAAACNKLMAIFLTRLHKVKQTRITDIKTAALVKYTENTFLALKVTFANEMFDIHKQIGCTSTFEDYTELVGLDERIGPSHMQVPGRDGKYGWGGHCYDKDLFEMEKFSKSKLIRALRKLNKTHRNKS